ncbi:hypothetical protein EYF80_054530 [Liparis tanakae]|uniref:Uncharacterized protein n=1 Tax=Liparis tanakae TaxID=230148 RepID=A0A4Z2F329_9TELE|nr:hypothetical protein EYF80_054530 [Liparis tanakae]
MIDLQRHHSPDVLHQLPDEPVGRRQHQGLVVELAGLQHRQQVGPPDHHDLAHAQQQTLQLRTQLHRLGGETWPMMQKVLEEAAWPCWISGAVKEATSSYRAQLLKARLPLADSSTEPGLSTLHMLPEPERGKGDTSKNPKAARAVSSRNVAKSSLPVSPAAAAGNAQAVLNAPSSPFSSSPSSSFSSFSSPPLGPRCAAEEASQRFRRRRYENGRNRSSRAEAQRLGYPGATRVLAMTLVC